MAECACEPSEDIRDIRAHSLPTPEEMSVILSGASRRKNSFALRCFVPLRSPALCLTLMSFKCGELTKNCISTPVRWTTLRRTNDVSGPRLLTDMSTPEKIPGACSVVTVSTEPGRSRSGCLRENKVASHSRFWGSGRP